MLAYFTEQLYYTVSSVFHSIPFKDLEFQVVSKELVFFGMDVDKHMYTYTHRQIDIYMHILNVEE